MSWELFRQKLAIMRKINIMGVVFKLPRVSIWDAVRDIWRCNTATSFSFGVLSPSRGAPNKKVEPINCIKNATYRPHLVLHWCHFINGFSYLIDCFDIDDTILRTAQIAVHLWTCAIYYCPSQEILCPLILCNKIQPASSRFQKFEVRKFFRTSLFD